MYLGHVQLGWPRFVFYLVYFGSTKKHWSEVKVVVVLVTFQLAQHTYCMLKNIFIRFIDFCVLFLVRRVCESIDWNSDWWPGFFFNVFRNKTRHIDAEHMLKCALHAYCIHALQVELSSITTNHSIINWKHLRNLCFCIAVVCSLCVCVVSMMSFYCFVPVNGVVCLL